MYIKSIVFDGFKLYDQRTEVTGFDNLFTAITGLNQTEKYNILDAIRFVLGITPGITNSTHVQATISEDLVYEKKGSITFDNTNKDQCPPGFENVDEITVTRQIVMSGKYKYLINGSNVTNKRVQDLFCSVQLNVNNPHFLIMQGKITKLLRMKAPEILAMLKEAAGTRMYEVKRELAVETIEKKDAKLHELKSIISEEINPKLNKLKEERIQYLEFQRMEKELEYMLGIHKVWQFQVSKKASLSAEEALNNAESKVRDIEEKIEENKNAAQLENDVQKLLQQNKSDAAEKLKALEEELKSKHVKEAKARASVKSINNEISTEEKKMKTMQENIADEETVLASKEQELAQIQSSFGALKEKEAEDKEVLARAQRKYELLAVGLELNDEGESQTLLEQLMVAKHKAAEAVSERKQAMIQLAFNRSQLQEKQKALALPDAEYQKEEANLVKINKSIESIDKDLKMNFSEEKMNELQQRRRTLHQDIQEMRKRLDACKLFTQFQYKDPETNFNRRNVHGVVCNLIQVNDEKACTALETAAGEKLYNVVVDSAVTANKLIQGGNLEERTTFIPLNIIQANKMDQRVIKLAQDLCGKENVRPALSFLNYDAQLQPAMEFIFGNVFICKDMKVAKKVAFHDQIRKRCVTLDGDVCDPAKTLSDGAMLKGGSILLQLKELPQIENRLAELENEFRGIETEIRHYNQLEHQLNMKQLKLDLVKQRLQHTEHHMQREEVNNLKTQIEELIQKDEECREVEKQTLLKIEDLERKINSKSYKGEQLKEAESEMKKAQQRAEKSQKEWQKHEDNYNMLIVEIESLKQEIDNMTQELILMIENMKKLRTSAKDSNISFDEIKQSVQELKEQIAKEKWIIKAQNNEIRARQAYKEKFLDQNDELLLEIRKINYEIRRLQEKLKSCKARETDYEKKLQSHKQYLEEGSKLSDKEGQDLERRIEEMQDMKNELGRKVNAKALTMFKQKKKQYNEIRKKQNIVKNDKKKLLNALTELDEKRKESLKLAFDQVSKDFGSIFSTLLPGAFSKLAAPFGMTIRQGIEMKVSLGGVWKESLTELSDSQRSLAALSLILAMSLIKPAPLYILDEVDVALYLSLKSHTHFKKSQFIIVSSKDGMFNNANVLFQTRYADGVSTVSRSTNRS